MAQMGLNFGPTFLKNRFWSVYVLLRGEGRWGSGDNVHLTLCVEKSICEFSLSFTLNKMMVTGVKVTGLGTLTPTCHNLAEIGFCTKIFLHLFG